MTSHTLAFLACAGLVLSACASADGPDGPEGTRAWSGPSCVDLYLQYDRVDQWARKPDNRTIAPDLVPLVSWLWQNRCITMTADLAPMDGLPVVPVADGGAVINPTRLHAGVVTSTADDARSIAFFRARGVPAYSIGAAGLGRRIYLGPFRTDGALTGARELAVSAGFAYPYVVQF
jgi:hypothetical protein